jgi:thiamine biosynthesis lipoprotein
MSFFNKSALIVLFVLGLVCHGDSATGAMKPYESCQPNLHVAAITAQLQRFEFSEPQMGTTFHFILYAESEAKGKEAARAGFDRAKQLNTIFSDYDEKSELVQLCSKAGTGTVTVSPTLADILQKSKTWSERSDGTFDITVGPLVTLWRRARRTRELPNPTALEAAKALVGYQHMQIQGNQVTLAKPKMKLDLGGIGKGYAADEVQKIFKEHGVTSALVAAGGDIRVTERPPGSEGWIVTVAPLEKVNKDFPARLILENAGVSTSGDIEQYLEINGVRYSHIIDPKTSLGLVGRMSATVVASCATDSDAATKPLCILGPVKGIAWINAQPGLAGMYMSYVDGNVSMQTSKAWSKLRFKQIKQP